MAWILSALRPTPLARPQSAEPVDPMWRLIDPSLRSSTKDDELGGGDLNDE